MIAVSPALHLLVALSMAAPTVDPPACAADDLHCSARAFTSAARRAKSDAERVEYLYFASRAYLGLSEKQPQSAASSRDLCQAKQLIEQAAALPATELRERVTKSRQETRTRLKKENIRCHQPKSRAKDDQPPVALAGSQAKLEGPGKLLPVTPPALNAEDPQSTVAPAPEAEAPGRTPAVSSGMPKPAPPHAEDPPVTVARTPEAEASDRTQGVSSGMPSLAPPTPTLAARVDHRWIQVGMGTLFPGLVLFVPMAGLLAYRGAGREEVAGINADTKLRPATEAETARVAALADRYTAATAGAVALGVTGAALVVTGAIFLASGRKNNRVALAPWGGRGIGGVVFQGRF